MEGTDPLIDFVSAVSGDEMLKVEENLGDGFVRLLVSEAERRQAAHDIRSLEDVVIELLRNARDAHAQRIFVASSREGDVRMLTVVDDGIGVPEHLHAAIFEPRVTSKLETMTTDRWGVHGRGMALFSVRSNVTDVHVAASAEHKGMAIVAESDLMTLPERADQSTWPLVETDEEGPHVVRGPHNIIRRVVEFACDHPRLDVFLGTPTEVLATAYALARDAFDASDVLFCDDLTALPLWQRPAACPVAVDLVGIAASLGLSISERTAHRVLASELPPLEPVLAQVTRDEEAPPEPPPDIYRDRRSLRIHHTDMDDFKRDLMKAFDPLSERYYLNLRGEPRVSVGRDEIRVRFHMDKEE